MDYVPAYIYVGSNKIHPVVFKIAQAHLSVLNCRTYREIVRIVFPLVVYIDKNSGYLFRIRYDRVYIFFSPFRQEIIDSLEMNAPQSLYFAAVEYTVYLTPIGLKFNGRYHYLSDVQYYNEKASIGGQEVRLLESFSHYLLFVICQFLLGYEPSDEPSQSDHFSDVDAVCYTTVLEEDKSLTRTAELSFADRTAYSPQQPMISSQILYTLTNLPADEDADVFAVAEALEGLPDDVQQILQAVILNDLSRLAVIERYDAALLTAYARILLSEQPFTPEQEELDEALGGLRALLLNFQEQSSQEVKDNSELSFQCAVSPNPQRQSFNPFASNAKTSYQSGEDNGCNTSSLTGKSAITGSSIKSKNTSVFSQQFKSYAMNDYYNSVEEAVKFMQQERICFLWIKKRFQQYKIALNCLFDLNSESVCEIFYSGKPKKPLLFNAKSTSFQVEKCLLLQDIGGSEAVEKYCAKKKIADYARKCLIFTNSYNESFMFMFDSEDERSRVQIATTMICDALVMPVVEYE